MWLSFSIGKKYNKSREKWENGKIEKNEKKFGGE